MIELRELDFAYPKGDLIVAGFSRDFAARTMVGLSGPSGRGKSTVLYLIGLMLRPGSGRVVLDGTDTTGLTDAQRSQFRGERIGFVFQDAVLDTSRSILDNVIEGTVYTGASRKLARHRALHHLAEVGVTVPPDRKPGQISGGQAQRVALCRALMHDPAVILADEPTGNLDPDSAGLALARLRRAADDGACVLIASHDPRVLDICDDVVALA